MKSIMGMFISHLENFLLCVFVWFIYGLGQRLMAGPVIRGWVRVRVRVRDQGLC